MKLDFLDKFGSVGTILVAASCPACWPLFIPLGSALGLGIIQPFTMPYLDILFPGIVMIAMVGSYFAYKIHDTRYPFIVTIVSGLLAIVGYAAGEILIMMYVGIFGILLGAILGIVAKKQCKVPKAA